MIFINDGSTDNTGLRLKELAQKDNRVVFIDKENGGVCSARNAGLEIAQGEYISFCDQDDYIDNRAIEILYQDSISYDVDMVIGQCTHSKGSNINSRVPYKCLLEMPKNVYSDNELFFKCSYGVYGDYSGDNATSIYFIWGKLFKKSLIKGHRFHVDLCCYEDCVFMLELLALSPKVFFESFQVYNHVYHDDSAMGLLKNKSDLSKEYKLVACKVKFDLVRYKLCCEYCNKEVIKIATEKIEKEIPSIIYCLIKVGEKNYYKEQKNFIKQIVKKLNRKNVSLLQRMYLHFYLMNAGLCWSVTRCILKLKKKVI